VQPGDSLWAIAGRQLGPEASDAQIARAWPQWWSANRAVVGDDPNLIHPGTHLVPPSRG
jgi:nucleoid-associated protein YgaU